MDEIRVTFGELTAAQQTVTSTATQIQGRLDDLKRQLAPLVADWTGAAAEQYQARQREIDTAMADLAQVLGQIGGPSSSTARPSSRTRCATPEPGRGVGGGCSGGAA